ncbi:MAG: hypothetical protein JRH20_15895 [Deltaproteobacteria bacterium]|nr:hypothetical protein [Deltaproteobacteria bacterium]
MTAALALLGMAAGWLTDRALPAGVLGNSGADHELELHEEASCRCFVAATIRSDWRPPSPYRATLTLSLLLVLLALASGRVGPMGWGWKRVTLLLLISFGLFIASTVPEHFLEDHLWRHVVVQHVPRIFLWTLGVFVVLTLLQRFVDLPTLLSVNPWLNLMVATLVGLLPESGPHLTFVVMYADGMVPLSILLPAPSCKMVMGCCRCSQPPNEHSSS